MLLDIQDISYTIQSKKILQGISFAVEENQVISIIGYNGSGKSTLLKLLLGSIQPTHGNIYRSAGARIGYVPQKLSFTQQLPITVYDFISIYNGKNTKQSMFSCSLLNLEKIGNTPLSGLSGGQLQKVLIYNALLGDPTILLLDEPTAGLDVVAQKEFYSLIEHIHNEHHVSIVLVSHDIHTVYSKSHKIICLHEGICCSGSPDDSAFSKEITTLLGGYVAPYLHNHTHTG